MNPYEVLIQRHAVPLLAKGEKIEASARVYTGGISQHYFAAAATSRRIILVEMKSDLLRITTEFAGISEISFADVEQIAAWSFFNLKHIAVGLRSGETITLALNNLTARIPGQERFVGTVRALHSRYQAGASDADLSGLIVTPPAAAGLGSGQTRARQGSSLRQGILGGSIAAVLSAAIWAAVSIVGEAPIPLMALGVGLLVGFSVRAGGRGTDRKYGFIAGLLALLSCALGRFLWAAYFFARGGDALARLLRLITVPAVAGEVLTLAYSPSSLILYLIAVFTAYGLAFRRLARPE